uniref:Reverse transcriptase domain-containing protein n=1 Tax=Tanacetum cinerariifolium TaxID=118510 RepID=A0A699JJ34_TANCI|nr:reverse transcriptase domain-containing protein [Tanacetum cinerariifolium]
MVTKLKNKITNFCQRPDESLFEAWERYKLSIDCCHNHNMLPITQIDTFYNGMTLRHCDTINAAAGGTFMKRHPEECYDLIENMTAHHNDWDTSAQRSESSSSITTSSDLEIVALKAEMAKINKNLMKVLQINQQVKVVTHSCETCGGLHSYNVFPATVGQTHNVYAVGAYNQGGNSYQPQGNRNLLSYHSDNYLRPPGFNQNQNSNQGNNHGIPQGNNQGRNQFFQGASHGQNPPPAYQAPAYQPRTNMTSLTNSNLELKNMFGQFMKMNTALSSGSGTLLSNTITNPKEDLKGITTRSRNAYKGPTIPTTSSPPKVVERETEVTKDTMPPTNNGSTKDVQPPVVQIETPIPNSEHVIALVLEPVVALVSAPKPSPKPSIPYPSRHHDQKLRDKANDQKDKFFKIFQDLDFNISFADALILMPKFGPTIKSLLTNKEKLFELARTSLNEHCSAVLLKKLPKKLRDPGKFLIPCDFPRMDECLALADLGASINC